MKTNIVFIVLFTILLFGNAYSQNKNGVYDFPIKGGTQEWKNLKTHDEMIKVLQIPENIANEMNTQDILQTCLNYPLFYDLWASNNLQKGFDFVIKDFNGFQELFKRDDFPKEILKKYKEFNISGYEKKWTDLEIGTYIIEIAKIEMLAARNECLSKMTKDEKKVMIEKALSNLDEIFLGKKIYGQINKDSNLFLLCQIIKHENIPNFETAAKENKKLNRFLLTASGADLETTNQIQNYAKNIITK